MIWHKLSHNLILKCGFPHKIRIFLMRVMQFSPLFGFAISICLSISYINHKSGFEKIVLFCVIGHNKKTMKFHLEIKYNYKWLDILFRNDIYLPNFIEIVLSSLTLKNTFMVRLFFCSQKLHFWVYCGFLGSTFEKDFNPSHYFLCTT